MNLSARGITGWITGNRARKTGRWLVRIAVMLAVWLVFAAIIHFLVMPLYVRKGRVIEVPELRHRFVEKAKETVSAVDFELVVSDERYDAEAPAGYILDQHPRPGRMTKRGRRIHLTVSAGPHTTIVPDVYGMAKDDAVFALQKAGLKVKNIRYLHSKSAYEGKVIGQDPEKGEQVSGDTPASIIVSLGGEPDEYRVPDVTGLPLDQATYLILKAGLTTGSVSRERYVRFPSGTVVVQKPEAGTKVEKDAPVDLVVNR